MERPPGPPGPRRGENMPPPGISGHRPTRSQEEALKARRAQGPRGPAQANSPQRRPPPNRRPRRNSESSLIDFDARPLTEEEKRMIESKRREGDRQRREVREAREGKEGREGRDNRDGRENREGKDRSKTGERNKSGRPSRRMDIIDQLDATSIYGTGRKYQEAHICFLLA